MKNQNLKQKIGQTLKSIFLCLALFNGVLKAQDKIVLTNGDELMAIVRAWNRARPDARQSFYDMAGDAELGVVEA